MTRAPAFNAWLDDFFAAYYRRRPVSATFVGVHDWDDRLPDLSPAGMAAELRELADLRARLAELPEEELTLAEGWDRQLAAGFLQIQEWEQRSTHFFRGNPSLYTGEAAFGIVSLLRRSFAPLEERAPHVVARMAAIPALLEQGQANIQQAPAAWVEKALDECAGVRYLVEDVAAWLAREQPGLADALAEAAAPALAAVERWQRYLADGVRRLDGGYACGAEAYALLLEQGHCVAEDAAAIEQYAAAELEKAKAYLAEHAADVGAASWQEALAQLPAIHPAADAYYQRYAELWQACRATAEQRQLLTWPDYPIRFVPQPEWARRAAPHLYFLFYHSPAPFDALPEVEYLVTPVDPTMAAAEQERRLRATNESVIKLNHVVHHGAIGHHVQNWHAFRAESRIGRMAAVDCAARIALFCGGTMAEGWACYATELMDEAGFLTPLESFAEQHTRLRMAARALADIRLHHGRITLAEAADFYGREVGMAPAAAHGEAVKNAMFPGTAAMYLIGADTIHGLRRELAARPGFELKRFHDRLLQYGAVPVTLIAAELRRTAPQPVEETP